MMTEQEAFDALVRHLRDVWGEDQATVAEHARDMINGWYKFSSNSVDDRGHETCRDWMDPEVVRVLDAALIAQYSARKLTHGRPRRTRRTTAHFA
jgi:hypothetical protein